MLLKIFNILKHFLPLAIVITATCGLVYGAVQQDLRQSANDPQIQIAEDIAGAIDHGQPPQTIIPPFKVDISKSLAPYVIIYDKDGNVLQSGVQLDGKTPDVPRGVFNVSQWKNPIIGHHLTLGTPTDETRFTWQPKDDVRSAAVIKKFSGAGGGYVLAGRSLREVEARVMRLLLYVGLAWVVTMGATFIAVTFFEFVSVKKKKR